MWLTPLLVLASFSVTAESGAFCLTLTFIYVPENVVTIILDFLPEHV
jgi:hypothetical protein